MSTSQIRRAPAFALPVLACFTQLAFAAPVSGANPVPGRLDLAAHRGHVVYLDFWASWCGPCKQSFPWMTSLHDTYAKRGLDVIAVDLDAHRRDADRFVNEFGPDFRIVYDPDGKLAERFKVGAMPTSVVIDRHGRIRYTHTGFTPAQAAHYEQQIERLLDEK